MASRPDNDTVGGSEEPGGDAEPAVFLADCTVNDVPSPAESFRRRLLDQHSQFGVRDQA